jgi:two-component system chemotaxis response regulator CheY
MKILIVEDYFISRIHLQDLLQDYGDPIHVAVDGHEAVQMVEAALEKGEHYNLILLDILMPRMNGQTALALIREKEQAKGLKSTQVSKIIMTTAQDDLRSVKAAYSNLCDGYLIKPVTAEQLQEVLAKK